MCPLINVVCLSSTAYYHAGQRGKKMDEKYMENITSDARTVTERSFKIITEAMRKVTKVVLPLEKTTRSIKTMRKPRKRRRWRKHRRRYTRKRRSFGGEKRPNHRRPRDGCRRLADNRGGQGHGRYRSENVAKHVDS